MGMFLRFGLNRQDVDELDHFEVPRVTDHSLGRKAHQTIRHREERIVRTLANIDSRADFCAALTNQDVARSSEFSSVFFDAKALTVRITAVPGGTLGHFCCHSSACIGRVNPHPLINSLQWEWRDTSAVLPTLSRTALLP